MSPEKRFRNLSPRQRYLKEFREDRMFNSYLGSEWDFTGDEARLNGYKSWEMRHEKFRGWTNHGRQLVFLTLMQIRHPEATIPF